MPIYGGQAVIEGVMMRSRSSAATAVRLVDGSIVVREMPLRRGSIVRKVRRIPVARGIAALWDVFALGTRSLAYSARMATVDPEADDADQDESDIWTNLMMAAGLGLGVILFFLAPLGLTALIDRWIESSTVSNLIEGLIRVAIVIGYLAAIGLIPDIYRTLQYHGAEHMTVNAVESRVQLTPESVIAQSRFHPRCGTSFLLTVVIISIIGFALLGRPDLWIRVGSRLVMIPIAAGIAFEVITVLASRRHQTWAKLLAAPGIWLQRLTTRRPELEQCEVAIAAIGPVLAETDQHLFSESEMNLQAPNAEVPQAEVPQAK